MMIIVAREPAASDMAVRSFVSQKIPILAQELNVKSVYLCSGAYRCVLWGMTRRDPQCVFECLDICERGA